MTYIIYGIPSLLVIAGVFLVGRYLYKKHRKKDEEKLPPITSSLAFTPRPEQVWESLERMAEFFLPIPENSGATTERRLKAYELLVVSYASRNPFRKLLRNELNHAYGSEVPRDAEIKLFIARYGEGSELFLGIPNGNFRRHDAQGDRLIAQVTHAKSRPEKRTFLVATGGEILVERSTEPVGPLEEVPYDFMRTSLEDDLSWDELEERLGIETKDQKLALAARYGEVGETIPAGTLVFYFPGRNICFFDGRELMSGADEGLAARTEKSNTTPIKETGTEGQQQLTLGPT